MILDCTYERLNILSTSELTKIISIAKEIINKRYAYAKYPPKTKSDCPECYGLGIDVDDFNLSCCIRCKGTGTIQNDEEDCKYPTELKSEGISYIDLDSIKFKDQYPAYSGYTCFKWVDIEDIDPNEYGYLDMNSNIKLIRNIRKHIGATNDNDIIISYKNKTYFAPAQYSTLFGYSVLSTYRDLIHRLNCRIEVENRKHRIRTFDLGNSCIDTGKTIYVGSDECHTCKCYGGSNGKNITCKIDRLDKK